MAQLGCPADPNGRRSDHFANVDIVNSAEYSGPDRGTHDHHDDQTDNDPSCFANDRHSPVASRSDHHHNERHHVNQTWFGTGIPRQDHDHHDRRCTFESSYDHVVLQDHWWQQVLRSKVLCLQRGSGKGAGTQAWSKAGFKNSREAKGKN
jgi:hypothetical protein